MDTQNYLQDDPVWLPRAQALGDTCLTNLQNISWTNSASPILAHAGMGLLTYHPSCHTLRGMNIDRQPRALLANVRGATDRGFARTRKIAAASAASSRWNILNFRQNG